MNQTFNIKVRVLRTTEKGNFKRFTEHYIVNAVSFTDAEQKMTLELEKMSLTDFEISAIKKDSYSMIIENEVFGQWYEVKVKITDIDDKEINEKFLIESSGLKEAEFEIDSTLGDYNRKTISVKETKILEVFN